MKHVLALVAFAALALVTQPAKADCEGGCRGYGYSQDIYTCAARTLRVDPEFTPQILSEQMTDLNKFLGWVHDSSSGRSAKITSGSYNVQVSLYSELKVSVANGAVTFELSRDGWSTDDKATPQDLLPKKATLDSDYLTWEESNKGKKIMLKNGDAQIICKIESHSAG